MWVNIGGIGHAQAPQQFECARTLLLFRHGADAEADVLQHRQMGEECRFLECQAHIPLFRGYLHATGCRNQGAAEKDFAAGRRLEACSDTQQRCFAAARRAEEADNLACFQMQVDVFDNAIAMELAMHAVKHQ